MSGTTWRARTAALLGALWLAMPPFAAGDDPFADLSGEWKGTLQLKPAPACDHVLLGGLAGAFLHGLGDISFHFTVQPSGAFEAGGNAAAWSHDSMIEKRVLILSGRFETSLEATARQSLESTCDGTRRKFEVNYEGRLERGKKKDTLSLNARFRPCEKGECVILSYYKLAHAR